MSSIVLATFGSLGDLHPYLAIGIGLKQRGHLVTLAGCESYRNLVEVEGLNFHPLRPDFGRIAASPQVIDRAFDPRTGGEFYVRQIVLPHVEQTHQDLLAACQGADLLLIHPTLFTAPIVAEKLKLKWLSVELTPGTFFSAHDPPLQPALRWLHALRPLGPRPQRWIFQATKVLTKHWMRGVDEIRKREGAQYRSRCALFDDMFSPYGTLACFSPLFGVAQPDWPVPSLITGFPFYEPTLAGESVSAELDAFLTAGEPPAVFTLGSSAVGSPGDFFEVSLAAAKQARCRTVFLMGPRARGSAPASDDRFFFTSYAAYSKLFPSARAVVHQGGIGTLACALRAGVPSLIVPWGLDQPDNAARAQRLGVARVLPRHRYTAARASVELRALLNSTECSENARRIGARVRSEDGVAVACEAIDHICAGEALETFAPRGLTA
jgi:UDP:flavonoid glycosyltransferase YjiC (YdhE family)